MLSPGLVFWLRRASVQTKQEQKSPWTEVVGPAPAPGHLRPPPVAHGSEACHPDGFYDTAMAILPAQGSHITAPIECILVTVLRRVAAGSLVG